MAKLWKSTDTEGKSRMAEIDLATLKITSPTVIYLSGFMVTDNRPGMISSSLSRLKELTEQPGFTAPPEVYIWSHTNLRNVFNLAAYNLFPQSTYSAAAETFAKTIIMPLVSDNGQPLPLEDARKNLRNLTFFGYSAGTITAQEVFNAALQLMQKTGYKKEDARKALQEIVLISTGTTSRPTKEKNRFTTLYLAASNDLAIRMKNKLWSPLRSIFTNYAKPLVIKPLSDTSLLITAAAKKKLWEWRRSAEGEKNLKDIAPLLPRWIPIHTYHELSHYISSDDDHSQFSKIVLNGLMNAVKRKEKMDVLQLLEPPSTYAPEETAAYRERIEKAIVRKNPAR